MIFTVLFYIFVAAAVIQLLYYLFFLSFAVSKPKKLKENELPAVSVIVCSKNEEKNLQKLIPKILQQNYSKFQLVLINDASTDNTLEVIQNFAEKDDRIQIVNVENNEAFWGNKKYALTLGIKAAKYNHLLFTDADCIPSSAQWIMKMAENFSAKKTIVLGYGKYKAKSTFTNLMVRYETLLTAIQYFSYAKLGSPYMAVGRNLAYTKDEFFKVKGFINHLHIKSGDDDLFIKDAANGQNTTFSVDSDGHTISKAPKNLKKWFRQKRRHISTANYYKFGHKLSLSLFFISKLLVLTLLPFLFFGVSLALFLPFAAAYFALNFIVIALSAKKLKEPKVVYFQPLLEIFLVLFQITIFIANTISKPTHWK